MKLDAKVFATFDLPVDSSTVTAATFSLSSSTGGIAGTVSYDDTSRTAIFLPAGLLPPSELLTATVTTDVRSSNGLSMATNEVWSFTTEALIPTDTTLPTVIATTPDAGEAGVSMSTSITAVFSEDLQPASVNNASVTLTRLSTTNTAVPGVVSFDAQARTATFTPSIPLQGSSSYEVTVNPGVRDLAGNGLAQPFTFTFTTEGDTSAPTVISTTPTDLSAEVARTSIVRITFSEAMEPFSLYDGGVSFTSYVYVDAGFVAVDAGIDADAGEDGGVEFDAGIIWLDGGSPVPLSGVITWDDRTRTAGFIPTTPFEPGAVIAGTVATSVTDLAGNALSTPHTFSFTAEAVVDAPHVVSSVPPPGARLVPRSANIKVTFDRALNAATVTAANFVISGQGAAVSWDAATRTATLTPPVFFPAASEVTVTVSNVEDSSGVAMTKPYAWKFRTLGDAVKLSIDALPEVNQLTAVTNGAEVMAAWLADSGATKRAQWALRQGSTWTGGAFSSAAAVSTPSLYVAGSRFGAAHSVNLLTPRFSVFDSGAWRETTSYSTGTIGAVGGAFVNITSNGPLDAYVLGAGATDWDGPTPVANQGDAIRVASSGTHFGVTYRVPAASGSCRLAFKRFDGTNWTFESTVASISTPCVNVETQLAANGTTFVVGYVAGANAYAATYDVANDSWTSKSFGAAIQGSKVMLAGSSAGFAAFVRTTTGLTVFTWDGSTWSAPVATNSDVGGDPLTTVGGAAGYLALRKSSTGSLDAVVVSGGVAKVASLKAPGTSATARVLSSSARGNGFAVTYELEGATFLRAYENGALGGERKLNISGVARDAVLVGPVVVNADNGALISRAYAGGTTLATPETVPVGALRGSASNVSSARTTDGRMLVTWTQFDVGVLRCFQRYYDGSNWSTPIRLPIRIAQLPTPERCVSLSNGRAFAVAWIREAGSGELFGVHSARWSADSGLGVPTRISSTSTQASDLRAESDGTSMHLLWSSNVATRGAGSVLTASSQDGVSWSAPSTVLAQSSILYEPVNFATSTAGSLFSTYAYGTTVTKAVTFSGQTQNLVSGDAPVAAGPWRLAALDVAGTTSALYLSTGGAFTSVPTGITSSGESAIAPFGDEFRVAVGGQTFVTSGSSRGPASSVDRWTTGEVSMKCDAFGCAMFGRQDPNFTELRAHYTSGNGLVLLGNVVPNAKAPQLSYAAGRYGLSYLVRDNSKDADEAYWIFE